MISLLLTFCLLCSFQGGLSSYQRGYGHMGSYSPVYYGSDHSQMYPSYPRKIKDDSGPANCKQEQTTVKILVIDEKGECIGNAYIYYIKGDGKFAVAKTDRDGRATIHVKDCTLYVVVSKHGREVAFKTLCLTGKTLDLVIEMKPSCNFHLLVGNEDGNPVEDAKVVYTSDGVSNYGETDYEGLVCIYAERRELLRAIAFQREQELGAMELDVASSAGTLTLPNFQDGDEFKLILNWFRKTDGCYAQLNVISCDDGCTTNSDGACEGLTAKGNPNDDTVGQTITWKKRRGRYLVYVKANDDMNDLQARVAEYTKKGKVRVNGIKGNAPRDGGDCYYVLGYIENGRAKRVEKYQSTIPQCSYKDEYDKYDDE